MNRVEKGKKYEEAAVGFLKEKGFFVLERNYKCRQGEVDVIGIHDNCLVFVEVKYRKDNSRGVPEEAVGVSKQKKICHTSDYFRISHKKYFSMQVRYDVVAITGDENHITWHRNAFMYQGNAHCF
ncbi:MAG: YraN family protein [Lachnospiraceae bacterium]|nr:YraN family protein [Lachnospiraceae bacterium]